MDLPDFELVELLADGPQTAVFQARHRTLDVLVALKQWKQPLSDEQRRRFLSECQIQHRLSEHPQVVRLLWAGVLEDGRAWLAMELFETSLQQRLETGSLPGLEEAAALADDLLAGLGAIHAAGLLHRDVKPANVLLKDGRAAVADLGIAMELSTGTEHAGAGTGGFIAPELASGAAPSCRSDVYSAAATLDYLFQGVERPTALDNLLDAATSFHPADRPADASVFRGQLAKVFRSQDDDPTVVSDSPQRRRWMRLAVLTGVLTLAGAGLATDGSHWDSTESQRHPVAVIPVTSAKALTPSSGLALPTPEVSRGPDAVSQTGVKENLSTDGAGGSASETSSPAVKVDAVIVEQNDVQAATFVFPQELILSPAELRTVNSLNTFESKDVYESWMRTRGGVDPYQTNIKLAIEGNRVNPIQIVGINVLKHCTAPLIGTIFDSPAGGGDGNITIGLDLDKTITLPLTLQNSEFGGPYFEDHTISLKQGEKQVIQIVAKTQKYSCEFKLEIKVIDAGTVNKQVVTNNGSPFKVTAVRQGTEATPFSPFKTLYAGGLASPSHDGHFVRKDPAKFRGW